MQNKEIENLIAELELAKEELHGICTACIHYNPDKRLLEMERIAV